MNFRFKGQIAKITAKNEDWILMEFRNGVSASFDEVAMECAVGDVFLVSGDSQDPEFEEVPSSSWPEEVWVGIVKLKKTDITIIDSSHILRHFPTTDNPCYEIGNTVLAGKIQGVIRVVSETPIQSMDIPSVDKSVIEKFRWKPPEEDTLDFDCFGGLELVVKRARELIELTLLKSQELRNIGARPIKGVLFTGPPGTGKTMLAQIIAAKAEATFYKISGPEIFSKWYGQSEELLRRLFEVAGKESKAIIFFDEIDSVAAQRGDQSHEASKRVVAQLLTLMDGFVATNNVVVIAATNRPQDLDVALRRPGRFDWQIEFPYPNVQDRQEILAKTALRLKTKGPLPHLRIAKTTDGWSGAELAAIWSEAALLAVADGRKSIQEEDYIGGFERVSLYRIQTKEIVQKGGNS